MHFSRTCKWDSGSPSQNPVRRDMFTSMHAPRGGRPKYTHPHRLRLCLSNTCEGGRSRSRYPRVRHANQGFGSSHCQALDKLRIQEACVARQCVHPPLKEESLQDTLSRQLQSRSSLHPSQEHYGTDISCSKTIYQSAILANETFNKEDDAELHTPFLARHCKAYGDDRDGRLQVWRRPRPGSLFGIHLVQLAWPYSTTTRFSGPAADGH